jgi:hypothetical protein
MREDACRTNTPSVCFCFVFFGGNTIQYCGTWGTWQVPIGWAFYLDVNVGLCLFFEEKFGSGWLYHQLNQ